MIAVLILLVSLLAFVQFFLSYCRALVATYRKWELSEEVRKLTGIHDAEVQAEALPRLRQLVQLCPESDDKLELRSVNTYFGLLNLFRLTLGRFLPPLHAWLEKERQGCAYFMAVALDRRIAHNRELVAQQLANRL
ncbi:MAG: hypothetical protein K6U02_00110 [Firmicutes bacterium]|nr:hypothetical protein [Bacillota bacterium]